MSIKTYTSEHGLIKGISIASNPAKKKAIFATVEITKEFKSYMVFIVSHNDLDVLRTANVELAMETYDNL